MRSLLLLLDDMHSGRCGKFAAHRDIKPPNLLMRPDGNLAVADLGFAYVSKPVTGAAQMPMMCDMLGSRGYMPFEMQAAAFHAVMAAAAAAAAAGVRPGPGAVEQQSSYRYDCSVDIHPAGITCMELLLGGLAHMALYLCTFRSQRTLFWASTFGTQQPSSSEKCCTWLVWATVHVPDELGVPEWLVVTAEA
jgi:serine/threonine protein kinase